MCVPKCDVCINGACNMPYYCECYEGYIDTSNKTDGIVNGTICSPECSPECENGECVAPNKCTCNEGYQMLNSTCSPMCLPECQNSYCSFPNICTCNKDYVPSQTEKHICHLIQIIAEESYLLIDDISCNANCANGQCFSNKCTCLDGYKNVFNKCVPHSSETITNTQKDSIHVIHEHNKCSSLGIISGKLLILYFFQLIYNENRLFLA